MENCTTDTIWTVYDTNFKKFYGFTSNEFSRSLEEGSLKLTGEFKQVSNKGLVWVDGEVNSKV